MNILDGYTKLKYRLVLVSVIIPQNRKKTVSLIVASLKKSSPSFASADCRPGWQGQTDSRSQSPGKPLKHFKSQI